VRLQVVGFLTVTIRVVGLQALYSPPPQYRRTRGGHTTTHEVP
jgi:hypothetical protein